MTKRDLDQIISDVSNGRAITSDLALSILYSTPDMIPELLRVGNSLRTRNFGTALNLCSIVNAKSGACGEDCAFCAQSAHHMTDSETYGLIPSKNLLDTYRKSTENPIDHFGIVTSGEGLDQNEVEMLCEAVKRGEINEVHWCASFGILDFTQLQLLKQAGLSRFHHNLETAESYFSNICTTHSYTERLAMIRMVKKAGLQICSGGILGLGESLEQRVEFAFTLRNEKVDSIPLNFHVAVKGTKLEHLPPMKPLEILKCIVMFRIVNPNAEIKVCAGRFHLRDLQSMIFYAGATGMMIGDLLTIAGRNVEQDIIMLEDLGLTFTRK